MFFELARPTARRLDDDLVLGLQPQPSDQRGRASALDVQQGHDVVAAAYFPLRTVEIEHVALLEAGRQAIIGDEIGHVMVQHDVAGFGRTQFNEVAIGCGRHPAGAAFMLEIGIE